MKQITLDIIILCLIGGFLFLGGLVLLYTLSPIPSIETIETIKSSRSIKIVDREGVFLFDLSKDVNTKWTKIENISENIKKSTIAIEDSSFYSHNGIKIKSFIRALLVNLQTLSFSQGGSTITQQVIKNLLLTGDKKVIRKLKEFLLAPQLEKTYSKDKILETYLNTSAYGGKLIGVGAASVFFFGKDAADVSLPEASYLAALLKAPTYYSPYGNNRSELDKRKNLVLKQLLLQKLITREEYGEAIESVVSFLPRADFKIKAPHFVFYIEDRLESQYGDIFSELSGSIIKTTLDLELQTYTENLLSEYSEEIQKRYGASNISVVIMQNKTGEILSMVGSKDYFSKDIDGKFNVTTSERQPGSAFKPFVYATAFSKGFIPETILFDVKTQFALDCEKDFLETDEECYSPINYTNNFSGPISLRKALAQSVNIPAVKLLYLTGIRNVVDFAKKVNLLKKDIPTSYYGLTLALGSESVSPLALANAYTIFPNEGLFIKHSEITEIRIGDKTLPQPRKHSKKVLSREIANTINDVLSDDNARYPTFPIGSALTSSKRKLAAKTGTTNNSKDIWVVGYTPEITALIWAGNNDASASEIKSSGFVLSKLWNKIIEKAAEKYDYEGNRFNTPSLPPPSGHEILLGSWDTQDNPHTILKYIDKNNINSSMVIPLDPQYENWQHGVTLWDEERDKEAYKISPEELGPASEFFLIENLTNHSFSKNDASIRIRVFSNVKNLDHYEFFLNGRLVEYSKIPIIFLKPKSLKGLENGLNKLEVIGYNKKGISFSSQTSFFFQKITNSSGRQ